MDSHFNNKHCIWGEFAHKTKKTWEIVYLQKETVSQAAQGSHVPFRWSTTTEEEKKLESKDLILGN